MAKRKSKGICVFCGDSATTRDHVPPLGVFPDPKPTDLITVPACEACNSDSKLDDEYFRWFASVGAEGSKDALNLIQGRILPRFNKRPALLIEIMKGATKVDFNSKGGTYLGQRPAFEYNRIRVQNVINKIVRGLYYHEQKSILPKNAEVRDFVLNPIFDDEFKNIICTLPLFDVGNSVFSYRFFISEKTLEESFWFLMFFDKTLLFIKTEPNTALHPTGHNSVVSAV